jgi:hypothetical protein
MILACFLATISTSAFADSFIYGINASNPLYVFKIDTTTGAVVDTYTGLSIPPFAVIRAGVAVVGNTMYYDSSTGGVYSYNLSTNTDNGLLFNVAFGEPGAISYDGANLWIASLAEHTNAAFLYSPTGTLLKTVTLADAGPAYDGLEYVVLGGTGYLIAGDGSFPPGGDYSLYDTNGNLIQAQYIVGAPSGTTGSAGIAFDGTDFYTSNRFQNSLSEWSESGSFIRNIPLTGNPGNMPFDIDDLSFASPAPVPEPSTFLLVGSSMLGLAGAIRRRFGRKVGL